MAIETILEFWFGEDTDDSVVAKNKSALWWSKNPDVDAEMRQRFESFVDRAAAGELSDWQSSPRGRLALILLTDQFPRNIYRDSPRAFAHDRQALAWCIDGIDQDVDLKLRPIERVFFYLPLVHAESLEHQDRSVKAIPSIARRGRRRPDKSIRRVSRFRGPSPRYHRTLRPLPAPQQDPRT